MNLEDRARGLRALAEEPHKRWRSMLGRFDALVAAGAPRRTLLVALSPGLEATKAFSATRDWVGKGKHGDGTPKTGILVLSGSVGVGKSVAAARYAIDTGADWAQATALGQEEYSRAARVVRRLIAAPSLVLDEVGGPGATSPAAVARISEVLVQRHAAGRPVVATTNMDIDAFAVAYDGVRKDERGVVRTDESRLVDRIRENGAYVECRRPKSFRVEGGVGPDSRENLHLIATRGVHLVGLLDAGDTDTGVLDELQDMLCVTDEAVADASQASGVTPRVQAQIDVLLSKLRPSGSEKPVTCASSVLQGSLGAYGNLEAIS